MTDLSPIDASLLALIAENRESPEQVKRLLAHTSPKARGIAASIVSPGAKGISKADRKTATAIRHWAATNKI
jgi:hypothetical protein